MKGKYNMAEKGVKTSITLSKELSERVELAVNSARTTKSRWISKILDEYLNKNALNIKKKIVLNINQTKTPRPSSQGVKQKD